MASHYRFAPKPVAVARGNQKGRVERAIQYIRHSFFAARQWDGLDDLNKQAVQWCEAVAGGRQFAEDRQMKVTEAYEQEKCKLMKLPDDAFAAYEIVVVSVGKTPYVRFDLNDYSTPHEYVQRKLTVLANSEWIRIIDGVKEVAKHKRCFEKRRQIESADHVASLVEQKKKAKKGSGMSLLFSTAPSAKEMFNMAAERGYPIGSLTNKLLTLLDLYGPVELEAAIKEVVKAGACHCSDVTQELERRRRKQGLLSPIAIQLPDDKRLHDFVVLPHSLASYDSLSGEDS